jgi:uncharacterized protein YidB (DUF937 family)
MPRDNLFGNQSVASYDVTSGSTLGFSSQEDLSVARALTDLWLTSEQYNVGSLSALENKFAAADAVKQFRAWSHTSNVSSSAASTAFISTAQLEKALDPNLVTEVGKRAGLQRDAALTRLTYVVPVLVAQVGTPTELASSTRAFRFSLSELRKRLK